MAMAMGSSTWLGSGYDDGAGVGRIDGRRAAAAGGGERRSRRGHRGGIGISRSAQGVICAGIRGSSGRTPRYGRCGVMVISRGRGAAGRMTGARSMIMDIARIHGVVSDSRGRGRSRRLVCGRPTRGGIGRIVAFSHGCR